MRSQNFPSIRFQRVVQLCLLIGMAMAQGGGGCADSSSCLGLSAGSSCAYQARGSDTLSCGTCVVSGNCVLACSVNSDQSTCNVAPTCTKLAAGTGGIGISQSCGTTRIIAGDAFKEPVSFTSKNGVLALTVNAQLNAFNATAFTMNSRQFCVGETGSTVAPVCTVPAATIRVKPGDLLTVTFNNKLPTDYTSSKSMNTLRTPNVANMHTHGLHVDPAIDNVMITVAPSTTWTYKYPIPTDHLPGTHWYHSHVHGASSFQVMGGMAGSIIVDPLTTWTPPSASYSAMASNVVHLSHVVMCTCNPTTDPFAYKTYPALQASAGDNLAPHSFAQQTGFSESDIVLVNGQYQPVMALQPGEWRRLEFINGVGTIYQEIEIRTGLGSAGSTACSMVELSIDGIFLRAPRSRTFIPMPPAGRASVAVMCPAAGTFYLQSYPQGRAADYEAEVSQNLITLKVSGTTMSMTQPSWTSADIAFPLYLGDLTTTTGTVNLEMGVDQTGVPAPAGDWLGVGADCASTVTGRGAGNNVDANSYGSCAYMPFDHMGSYRFAAPSCTVVNFYLNGRGKTPHPIHQHVHPFQVLSHTSDNGGNSYTSVWGAAGDYRDVMPALAGRSSLRFRTSTFRGAIMVHCHFLVHEDMGMMDRWWTGTATSAACTATSVANNCNSSVPAAAFLTTFDSQYAGCAGESTGVVGSASTATTTAAASSTTTAAASSTTTAASTTTTAAPTVKSSASGFTSIVVLAAFIITTIVC